MSKLRFLLPLITIFALLGQGCGNPTINAELGKEFPLKVGQTAYLASENLSINFVGVPDDSRCPTGVKCIWAGQVACDFQIKLTREHTQTAQFIVYQSGASDSSQQLFENYLFHYSVEPYPVAGKKISQGDYIVHLTVTKQ